MNNSVDNQLIDFIDLVDETLSNRFTQKWKYKYSSKFIKHFQLKILQSLSNQKPLKLDTLFIYLSKTCGYAPEQVVNFFDSVDIDLYRPLIQGKLTKYKIQ